MIVSTYTTTIRDYIESFSHYQHTDQIPFSNKDKIELGRKHLFDFDYPIFDSAYRKVFETHFIRNFYMREVGFETMGLFKFRLETWLIINMPYFNKLFESEMIAFDPLVNSKMSTTHSKKNDRTQNDKKDSVKKASNHETTDLTNNKTSSSKDDTHLSSDQVSNTSGSETSDTDTTHSEEQTGTKGTTGEKLNDNFNRDLKSDNPDSRLAITSKDGEGVIEYAKSIEEQNTNNKETVKNDVTETKEASGTDTSKNKSSTNVDSTSVVTGSENRQASGEENEKGTETSDRQMDMSQNDQLESNINDVEDFIEHRTGKIGNQSYSKMLQEYRESFIRIENKIFDEMQELFMLVY